MRNADKPELSDTEAEDYRLYRWLRYLAVSGILLTGLSIGGLFTWQNHVSQQRALTEKLYYEAELHAYALAAELNRLSSLTTQITSRTRIRQELDKYNQGLIRREELAAFTAPKLQDPMRLIPDLLGIVRLDAREQPVVAVGDEIPADKMSLTDMGVPWATPDGIRLTVSAEITNRSGERVGRDVALFRADRLDELMADFIEREPGLSSIFLTTLKNKTLQLMLQQGEPLDPAMPIPLLMAEYIESTSTAYEPEIGLHELQAVGSGVDWMILHRRIGDFDWALFMLGRKDELLQPVNRQTLNIALTVGLLILVGCLFAYGFMRPMSRRLVARAKNMSDLLQEKKGLLDEVEENKSFLQSILDNTPSVVYVKDVDGKYLLVNQAFEQFSGTSKETIIGRTDYELFAPEIAERFRQNDLDVLKSGGAVESDEQAPHEDGLHDYLSVKFPLRDAVGESVSVCGISTDITERKAAENRLRQSAKVFERSGEGLVVTDPNGTIVDVNPALCRIMGYTRAQLLDKNPRLWKSQRHDDAFYQEMWHQISAGRQWRGEVWNRTSDGGLIPVLLSIDSVLNDHGEIQNFIAVYSDISTLKKSQQELEYLAHHDVLTKLPNRVLFNARLIHALDRAKRRGVRLAVLFLDLDKFKNINDSLGHNLGDQLLAEVAVLLKNQLRTDDTVARIGGDEFTFLLEEIGGSDDVIQVVEKVLNAFDTEFDLAGHKLRITPSMGVSIYPDDGTDPETLLRNADSAMYRAKAEGRNTYQFYTEALTQQALEYMRLEADLRQGLANHDFQLHYQPQLDLKTGELLGMEVLVRWQHPDKGLLMPDRFIPIAEEMGVIHELDEWVMEQALKQVSEWRHQGLSCGHVAVNLSGKTIFRGGLANRVEAMLQRYELDTRYLEIELTESFVMDRTSKVIDELNRLRRLNIQVAVDDFGTGYSSLAYLKTLPIDRLKIDKSFIRDIPGDANDVAITQAIIALGDSLGLQLIAEGVETEAQRDFLLANGCPLAQGYLFSRPLDGPAMSDFLQSNRCRED